METVISSNSPLKKLLEAVEELPHGNVSLSDDSCILTYEEYAIELLDAASYLCEHEKTDSFKLLYDYAENLNLSTQVESQSLIVLEGELKNILRNHRVVGKLIIAMKIPRKKLIAELYSNIEVFVSIEKALQVFKTRKATLGLLEDKAGGAENFYQSYLEVVEQLIRKHKMLGQQTMNMIKSRERVLRLVS